ncbi:uncharacterized protein LOC120000683 [Tripterygium wilfordii]|uniref:uncharacterized protein LOC120000683 n=1 Tax=Tripterygium wilfordii TaxID=458696 RepID=UPI0018F83811|nr:uncharacterized protein LOC120000683 [Tripterygium wilfordii]
MATELGAITTVVGAISSTGTVGSASNSLDDPLIVITVDYAVNKLVSLVLTGDDTCHTWSRTIFMALEARNKQSLVDGTLSDIAVRDSRHTEWKRCNSLVVTWLLNCVSNDIAASLSSSVTARALWYYHTYHSSNDTRIYESDTRQGSSSVIDYYTKQKSYSDELLYYNVILACNCGVRAALELYQQKEHTMLFLMGLNESFSNVRSQVLSMGPLPSINKVLSMVLHVERQLTVTQPTHTTLAPLYSSTMAVNLGRTTEIGKGSTFSTSRQRENLSWNYCRKQGHTIDKCYKLNGYPPGLPKR